MNVLFPTPTPDATWLDRSYQYGDEVQAISADLFVEDDEEDIFESLSPQQQDDIDAMLGGDLEVTDGSSTIEELSNFYTYILTDDLTQPDETSYSLILTDYREIEDRVLSHLWDAAN